MGKLFFRKKSDPYCLIQFRLTVGERDKLKVLCAELGLTLQEFIRRILRGAIPDIMTPNNLDKKIGE